MEIKRRGVRKPERQRVELGTDVWCSYSVRESIVLKVERWSGGPRVPGKKPLESHEVRVFYVIDELLPSNMQYPQASIVGIEGFRVGVDAKAWYRSLYQEFLARTGCRPRYMLDSLSEL